MFDRNLPAIHDPPKRVCGRVSLAPPSSPLLPDLLMRRCAQPAEWGAGQDYKMPLWYSLHASSSDSATNSALTLAALLHGRGGRSNRAAATADAVHESSHPQSTLVQDACQFNDTAGKQPRHHGITVSRYEVCSLHLASLLIPGKKL